MNTGRPPFDKPQFRQAMAAAVNNDDIVATALLGAGATGSPGLRPPLDAVVEPGDARRSP